MRASEFITDAIDRVPGGWKHHGLGYRQDPKTWEYPVHPLPKWKKFSSYNRNKEGSSADILHYMMFTINDYATYSLDITGNEIANTICKLYGTDPNEELKKANAQYRKGRPSLSWSEIYQLLKDKTVEQDAIKLQRESKDDEFHTGGGLGIPSPGTYEQEYNKFKRKGARRITAMTNEDTTTLTQIYQHGKPDDNERIWDYGDMIWDNEYEIKTINPRQLEMFLCDQYDVEGVEDLFDRMEPEQHDVVDDYINDPSLSNQIIVMDDGFIVDGNHRAIAAALTRRPIKYIDISDEQER